MNLTSREKNRVKIPVMLCPADISRIVPFVTVENQSCYRPEVPRGFQEVKVPRLRDNGPGWW